MQNIKIPQFVRIIIVEGVAGSGKDTLQKLLKEKLINKTIYDYSEEELLFTWKLARVKGIAKLRLKFLNYFTEYMSEVLRQEHESIFLLNRFHLSNYMAHVSKDKSLQPDYNRVIKKLSNLPVHILLLQLSAEEIDERSSHIERPAFWKKYQQAMLQKEGFTNRAERYLNEQRTMLEAAKKDALPFSLINLNL